MLNDRHLGHRFRKRSDFPEPGKLLVSSTVIKLFMKMTALSPWLFWARLEDTGELVVPVARVTLAAAALAAAGGLWRRRCFGIHAGQPRRGRCAPRRPP